MVEDVKQYIKNCQNCQLRGNFFEKTSQESYSISIPKEIVKQIGVDLCKLSEADGFKHLEGVYMWNFIPGMKLILGQNHPVKKTGMKFHLRIKEKEKKACKHFILGWNFKMSMFFLIFDVCILICFPKLTCLNIMKVWI